MNYYKLTLFFATLIGGFTVHGQDALSYKSQIKIALVRLVNLFNPGVALAYELNHGQKFATQISGVYLLDCFGITEYKDYSGYQFSVEEKFYFAQHASFRRYFSLETGYYNAQMIVDRSFYPAGTDEESDRYVHDDAYEDEFNLKRKGMLINAKYGMVFPIKQFTVDLSFGAGVLIHNIIHSNKLNPQGKMVRSRHPDVYHMMVKEGKSVMPNPQVSIKFGYRF